MTPAVFLARVLDPGLDWLESVAGVTRARVAARPFLLAVALQESGLVHRAQVVSGGGLGPARGWWQFEQGGGVAGVLRHAASAPAVRQVCAAAHVRPEAAAIWRAIEGHDMLATAVARLLLLTDPQAVPLDEAAAWACYRDRLWRPGKPHAATWPKHWASAQAACA